VLLGAGGAQPLAPGQAPQPTDGGHVGTVAADRKAAFFAREAGLLGAEFMGRAELVSGTTAGLGDLSLAFLIQLGKAAV
jgi:hypothetical protein